MKNKMQYSKDGLHLTQQFESCRLIPYKDGGGVWTDGWGNTHNVDPSKPITQAKADADLLANIQVAVSAVNILVSCPLDQEEFDALVDFVFNIGYGQFKTSTLLRKLNALDYHGAAEEFENWDMDNGKHIAGLLRRRIADKDLFKKGDHYV